MSRSAGTTTLERLLLALRQRPGAPDSDATSLELVRAKLTLVSARPEAITARADRGCIVLTGQVPTRERARVVRAIASVRGVDSVVDLMTEEPWVSPTVLRAPPRLRLVKVERRPGARILGASVGLGLALLGLGRHGLTRAFVALGGAILVLWATGLSLRRD